MYAGFLKRLFDFLLALTALCILSPILVILMIVGAVAMGGNPFFTQLRPGRIDKKTGKERIFKLVKFRSMSNKKDADGNLLPDKERLNKYGRILRSTSLDELPELWNILIGDMSLIGPRPLLPKYLEHYNDWERQRHLVRPGLTGLAQVSGRNALTWRARFEKDVEYVQNVSFLMDMKIIFLTVKKVFAREGIEFKNTGTIMEYFAEREEKQ